MRRCGLGLVLGGWLAVLAGCGGDPAPKTMSAEEEKQFEQQREKERQHERRAAE